MAALVPASSQHMAALQQPAPSFAAGGGFTLTLRVEHEYPLDDVCTALLDHDFERVDQVTGRGEWSLRGGILDVFPLQSAWPLRIEFFGDEVESIRAFDIDSQLSFKKLETADLVLDEPEADKPLGDWIDKDDWVISLPGCGVPGHVLVYELPPDREEVLPDINTVNAGDGTAIFGTPLGSFETGDFVMQEARRQLAGMELRKWREQKWRVVMFFPHEGEKERFEEICGEDDAWSGVQSRDGDLPLGFSIPGAKLAILSAAEIFGRYSTPRNRKQDDRTDRMRRERAQAPLREIEAGDFVIHASHGLGKFVGIVRDEKSGEEEIHIKYADGVLLRIPLQQSHLVSKYVGLGARTPELSKLGDARWRRACQAAEKAVMDYAAQLLEVQAERESNTGYAHPADSGWMWQFESSFPYRETPDQLRAISQTKADMESGRPMDRLICGDVGFGKTEVALRAAMKAMLDGKQVAILVPTTVLAQQHYVTAMKRFAGFPVNIDVLSRFRTAAQQKKTLQLLAQGHVDLIIGTPKLLQKNIQFKNLGLLIVDEEQRFGVTHKERLKELSVGVDVLTLSATPIPRTLNMALSGLRDMSTIETPPSDRYPVQTFVLEHDDRLLDDAIRRELTRGGQVYFLHNRTESIEQTAAKLKRRHPDAEIATAHGKMNEQQLGDIMERMAEGEVQILVCTTIIETGIDIPNVNTLIIEDADKLGLAQLHQLRGRVGRSSRHAFAYLTFRKGKVLTEIAEKRLSAIREFAEFGSGFKIAMRDLEIRGAGDLLGAEQSGHMMSVGYDMYLKLLEDAVLEEKGEERLKEPECVADLSVTANIAKNYVASGEQRMDLYRRMAAVRSQEDADELLDEIVDRYGDPPKGVMNLIAVALLRAKAAKAAISRIEQKGDTVTVTLEEFDFAAISAVCDEAQYKKRIFFSAGEKPMLSLKLKKGEDPLKAAEALVASYRAMAQKE